MHIKSVSVFLGTSKCLLSINDKKQRKDGLSTSIQKQKKYSLKPYHKIKNMSFIWEAIGLPLTPR